MKIVICDDRIEDLLKMEKMLSAYGQLHAKEELVIEKYSDPGLLYHKIQEKELADLYLLDMVMPEKSGIEIGQLIRKCGMESIIIYITSSDDFALDAYGVHAVRYLLKPIGEAEFFEALEYAWSCLKLKKEARYLLKTKEGLVSLAHSQIEYIENSSRMLCVHLAGGEMLKSIFIRKSFDEEIKGLSDDMNFMKVHKSFLINLRYVKKLNQRDILMESGCYVPISKMRAAEVKKQYLSYVIERYQ